MFVSQTVEFDITQEDIDTAPPDVALCQHDPFLLCLRKTPLSLALSRLTGTSWRTVGRWVLVEEEAPYRFAYFPTFSNDADNDADNASSEEPPPLFTTGTGKIQLRIVSSN